MNRVERLLEERHVSFDTDWSESFHDAWMAHADKPHLIRLAHAAVAQWLGARMIVEPDELIVGRIVNTSIVS